MGFQIKLVQTAIPIALFLLPVIFFMFSIIQVTLRIQCIHDIDKSQKSSNLLGYSYHKPYKTCKKSCNVSSSKYVWSVAWSMENIYANQFCAMQQVTLPN